MSVKQRLEYGIYPIASRRHQPRDNWNTFQEFPHDYTPDESKAIIASWVATPIIAMIADAMTQFSFGEALILMIIIDLLIIYEVKHG